MNKSDIKNFSVWARNKLIEEIIYKAGILGITENGIAEELPASTDTLKFYDIGTYEPIKVEGAAIEQRKSLVSAIKTKAEDLKFKEAFEYIVEETAYTWFNRLIAIRFMEVNDYLPSGVRVLSSEMSGKNEPDMVSSPFETDMTFTDSEKELMLNLKDDELFRFLFIKQCHKLGDILPELFDRTDSYKELLLTISFTDTDSVVYHLVHDIPEDDFNINKIDENTGKPVGQVQIIGWLYQYYNIEPKDKVFAALKKNVKITKENIPAATQLFTPDWIVRYMVENSLGRLWADGHKDCDKSEWKYYLDEAEQEADVKAQLDEIRANYKNISPEDIKFLDPCMGSGHILIYAFDVFMQIYTSQGYTAKDAVAKIILKNLYGTDIDKRAYQLSYFALMMKARQYDRNFFTRYNEPLRPNLAHFQELSSVQNANVDGAVRELAEQFRNCDTYGSLTEMKEIKGLDEALDEFNGVFDMELDKTERMMRIYKILSQKYNVVCTNPPYMGSGGMDANLTDFVKKNYPDSKSDLFAVFIEKCGQFTKKNGYYAMITQHAFMFLSSYEKLRAKLMHKTTINMAHLGARAFDEIGGEVVQTTAFVNCNSHINDYKGTYARLVDIAGENEKKELFLSGNNRHTSKQENFLKIPGSPVAYWWNNTILSCFDNREMSFGNPMKGIQTGNGERFLRLWFEVELDKLGLNISSHDNMLLSKKKWFPLTSGGILRRWYGNYENVVNLENNGKDIRDTHLNNFRLKEPKFYFLEGLTWTEVTTKSFSCRYLPNNILFGNGGPVSFLNKDLLYLVGLLNSKVANEFFSVLAPTMNYGPDQVRNIPYKSSEKYSPLINNYVQHNITLSKTDWDSFETSWDFKRHPFLKFMSGAAWADKNVAESLTIRSSYELWERQCTARFNTLKKNEEELNRIFIDIYGLQDELTPEVEDKDVTVRTADLQREIKSLISYAVGCMFGRYSLNVDGLAYAGGEWDESKYKTFIPDADNCIPITDEEYFDDDIVCRFVDFVKVVYGEDTLEENLDFIAEALGTKGNTSRQKIRSYFLNDFIKDHNKIYQKRPIYWLFDSGKQNSFKALVYMHRWNADTIGNVRVEYLHKIQRVYESEISRMQETIDNDTNSREITLAEKRKDKLTKQLKEARDYDTNLSHLALSRIDIDLDDGVKVNYEKVQTGQDGKKLEILAALK